MMSGTTNLQSTGSNSALSPIEEIIEEMQNGRMVILVDAEDRENEGDLVIPAEMATPDAINFMAKHGRGLICLALTPARAGELNLPISMVRTNGSRKPHRLHRVDRSARRHLDRYFRFRPGAHDRDRHRSDERRSRHRLAGSRLSADRARRRRPRPRRPHRSIDRSCEARRSFARPPSSAK